MEKAKPTKEHEWLRGLTGEWIVEGKAVPDVAEYRSSGTETGATWGDFWVVLDGEMRVAGSSETARSRFTLGYDPDRGVFVGSFTSTHMPSLWVYEGSLDDDGKALRLKCRGPRMDGQPGETDYVDTFEIVSGDHRRLRSTVRGDDGQWSEFMVAEYRRAAGSAA